MLGLNAVKEALLGARPDEELEQARQMVSQFAEAGENLEGNKRIERGFDAGRQRKSKDAAVLLDQQTFLKARAHIDRKYTRVSRERRAKSLDVEDYKLISEIASQYIMQSGQEDHNRALSQSTETKSIPD